MIPSALQSFFNEVEQFITFLAKMTVSAELEECRSKADRVEAVDPSRRRSRALLET